MKTLINKNNPQIRITAPDIEENEYQYTVNVGKLQPLIFLLPEWTLVEEEPKNLKKQKEQKPVEWSEEDEKNIGKLHRLLVICQSEKKFIPTSEYEKLDKWLKSLRPKSKEEQEQQEVDLEKEIDKTVSECTNGYNFDWDRFARHFYELGRIAQIEQNKALADMHKSPKEKEE